MRAVGEFCVHPGQGVCLVENVVSEPIPAYVLSPIGQKHPVQIVFPLNQEFRLRDLMTHDEAMNLVDTYPQIKLITALNCTVDEIQRVFSSRYGVEIGKAQRTITRVWLWSLRNARKEVINNA